MSTPHLDDHQLDGVRGWLIDLVHQHRLSPTQRRVVQHMLDSLPQVAFASTIDMAEAAGVSQPTVTRIATALGFSGYAEFRNAARDAVLTATPPAAGAGGAGGAGADRARGVGAPCYGPLGPARARWDGR
ncbi:hypothetical protein FRIG_13045, partial [Frigoribacterium faeni]|uniref:MurR/RpiR family transcriptional regulator n=1 Tax=Frigoribacterium faeni TaxID=145483 RepID=UPI0035AE6999|nr:hypothetical protein [Frigoribacterium faeni]